MAVVLEREEDNAGLRPRTPVYLVLEQNPTIAEDIADALRVSGPCLVLHARRPEHVLKIVADTPELTAAFLEIKVASLAASPLANELAARGAHIVLTTGEDARAEALAMGFRFLGRPFNETMIHQLVAETEAATRSRPTRPKT